MKNYIQPGKKMTFTAAAAVESGDIVKVGSIIGIASCDYAIGEEGELAITGVYSVPKEAIAISQGDTLYFDEVSGQVDKTNTNTLAGYAFTSALSGDATVNLLLARS